MIKNNTTTDEMQVDGFKMYAITNQQLMELLHAPLYLQSFTLILKYHSSTLNVAYSKITLHSHALNNKTCNL